MNLNLNVSLNKGQPLMIKQLITINAFLHGKPTKELKVLAYMLRHSHDGYYVIRRNYCSGLAKSVNSTVHSVKKIVGSLKRKKLLVYITNQQGNNLGVYEFHPAISAIAKYPSNININFKTE